MKEPSKSNNLIFRLIFKLPHHWRYVLAEWMVKQANRIVLNPVWDKEHGFGYEFVDHRTSDFSKMGVVNQGRAIAEAFDE